MNNNDYTVVPLKKAVVNKYINFAKNNMTKIISKSRNSLRILNGNYWRFCFQFFLCPAYRQR